MIILDGDAILTKDKDDLEDAISQMEIVLGSRQWNPRNIPFHTVIKFRETENPKKPKITRGLVRGHYRTDAYNQYVEWALKHKKDIRICMHKKSLDKHHDMIILQQKKNFYLPHKHLRKGETYHIIKGRMVCVLFNNNGKVKSKCVLKVSIYVVQVCYKYEWFYSLLKRF